jgi:hypothetical protein
MSGVPYDENTENYLVRRVAEIEENETVETSESARAGSQ